MLYIHEFNFFPIIFTWEENGGRKLGLCSMAHQEQRSRLVVKCSSFAVTSELHSSTGDVGNLRMKSTQWEAISHFHDKEKMKKVYFVAMFSPS